MKNIKKPYLSPVITVELILVEDTISTASINVVSNGQALQEEWIVEDDKTLQHN